MFVERARDPADSYDKLVRAYRELNWREGVDALKVVRDEFRRGRA